MTASRDVTIWCDWGYDPSTGHRPCAVWETTGAGDNARETRRELRRIGWRYVPGGVANGPARDLCPIHAHSTSDG